MDELPSDAAAARLPPLLLGWAPRPSVAEAAALLGVAVAYARFDGVVGRATYRAALGEGLLMLPPAVLLGKTTEVVLAPFNG